MQHLIKRLLHNNSIYIAITVTIVIAYLSLIKTPKVDIQISNFDKVLHGFAYFTLALSWFFVYYTKRKRIKWFVVFCCIFYGIILEILQKVMTTTRTADVLDFLANTVGVFLAFFIFNIIYRKIEGI